MAATKTKKKPVKPADNGAVETGDVLTLAEAAAYLRVSEQEVLDGVQNQGLTGRRIGRQWRFLKSTLRTWLGTPAPKSPNEALLALWGAWKDDPDAEEMLREIYKQRGRPMTEEGE